MTEDQKPPRVSFVRQAQAVNPSSGTLASIDPPASQPIAIIGMGCRFPGGANDPDTYWEMLRQGVDGIRKVPDGRWPNPKYEEFGFPEHVRYGGYLEEIDGFDAAFFGIAPRDVPNIDPQQRLLLEVTWEALWDAGLEPTGLTGQGGVFAGIGNSDYLRISLQHVEQPGAPNGVNSIHSVAAGRISYLLNLQGPCIALDTACSSSLVSTHLACQSLRAGECDIALAGGVSLKPLPDEMFVLNRLRALSKSSRCRSFDAKADGFVVGEGCGMIVLKRLDAAVRDGDRIRAVIRGSAVNHDGRTAVLTSPNVEAQEAVMRQSLRNAGVHPGSVSYVETHGTGTPKGDPIELRALHAIYGLATGNDGQEGSAPCVLGAVKSNLGHLEAAAGVAGIIKTVLAMENESIPKNLHFNQANPGHWREGTRLKLAEHQVVWPRGGTTRRAGVSAFGLGGTNAHVVLEEAPVLLGRLERAPLKPHVWQRSHYWVNTTGRFARRSSRGAAIPAVNGIRLRSPFLRTEVVEFDLDAASVAQLEGLPPSAQSTLSRNGLMELVRIAARLSSTETSVPSLDTVVIEPLSFAHRMKVQVSTGEDGVEVVSEGAAGWTRHLWTLPQGDGQFQAADANRTQLPLSGRSDTRERGEAKAEKGSPEAFDAKLPLEQIARRVRREAALVMEIGEAELPLDEPLINLGMDSIMAMELQHRLQAFIPQQLPANLAFTYPSIEDLSKWIRARLWAANKVAPNASTPDQMEEVEI